MSPCHNIYHLNFYTMDYQKEIASANVVLVEFFATWCPHCRRMAPVVEQLAMLLEGKARVVRFDIDRNSDAASMEGVENVPTFIIYRHGEEMWRGSGEFSGDVLYAKVEACLS